MPVGHFFKSGLGSLGSMVSFCRSVGQFCRVHELVLKACESGSLDLYARFFRVCRLCSLVSVSWAL